VRNLSPDEQDNIARAVLRLIGTDDEPPVAISTEERAAIADSKSACHMPPSAAATRRANA
jgi:hypothetical protein